MTVPRIPANFWAYAPWLSVAMFVIGSLLLMYASDNFAAAMWAAIGAVQAWATANALQAADVYRKQANAGVFMMTTLHSIASMSGNEALDAPQVAMRALRAVLDDEASK